jgi:hypothetical protein
MSYASENAPKPAREKGRFAKGSSGNPLGRPKKERSEGRLADRVDSVINRMVKVKEGEHVREVPKIDALIEKVLNEAIAGDHQSRRELIDLLRHIKSFEPASPKHGQGGVLVVPGMATDADAWEKRVAANQAQYRGNRGNPAETDES